MLDAMVPVGVDSRACERRAGDAMDGPWRGSRAARWCTLWSDVGPLNRGHAGSIATPTELGARAGEGEVVNRAKPDTA